MSKPCLTSDMPLILGNGLLLTTTRLNVKSMIWRKTLLRGTSVSSHDQRGFVRIHIRTTTTVPVDEPESSSLLLYHEWIHNAARQQDTNHNLVATTIVFLHGMLANSSNIKSMARKVCRLQNSRGLLLDLPGHGRSRNQTRIGDEMNFRNTVHWIQKTVNLAMRHSNDRHSSSIIKSSSSALQIMGHSIGGHLSLYYTSLPDVQPKPSVLWLLDTVPGVVDASFLKVWKAVKVLQGQESLNPETMKQVLIRDFHLAPLTAQWVESQYHFSEREFVFDRNVIESLLQDFANQNFYSQLQTVLDSGIIVHLVQAENNRAWKECSRDIRVFDTHDNFFRHILPNAGHLVYIDNLPGLLNIVGTCDSMVTPSQ